MSPSYLCPTLVQFVVSPISPKLRARKKAAAPTRFARPVVFSLVLAMMIAASLTSSGANAGSSRGCPGIRGEPSHHQAGILKNSCAISDADGELLSAQRVVGNPDIVWSAVVSDVLAGGGGALASDTVVAETTPPTLGSFTPSQVRTIQAFSDRFGAEVNVVGSRAAGTAGPLSDFDYVIGGNASLRNSASYYLARGTAGGENTASGGATGID